MAATKFGILVTSVNAIILGYVYPTNNADLNSFAVAPGITLIQLTNGPFPNTAAWVAAVNNAVQTALGKPPANARCCVIDGLGNVVRVFMGDATLDATAFPGMTLINSVIGDVGWTWTAQGGFVPPPET